MQKVVGRLVGNRFGLTRVQAIGLQTGCFAPERAGSGVPSTNPSIDSQRPAKCSQPNPIELRKIREMTESARIPDETAGKKEQTGRKAK